MANHQVMVITSDETTGTVFAPPSLAAAPGDIITFQASHRGSMPPSSIRVVFTSQNVCEPNNASRAISEIMLSANGSGQVQVIPNARKSTVTYQTDSGASSIQSSPELIYDDDD